MSFAEESGSKVVGAMEKRTKGRFPVYVPGLNVSSYLQTVDIFFALNKTPNDEKALEFITSVGQETANRIIGSFKPDNIVNKTYAQIVEKFKILHEENKNVFAERHRLITRKQEEGESLDDFAIDLQNIVEHCSVSAETEATLVQSVFVAGIRNDKTRESMLRDADHSLNLAKLLEKAKTIEIAAQESRKMSKQCVEHVNYVGPMSSARIKNVVKPGKFDDSAWGGKTQKEISSYGGNPKSQFRHGVL
ncbi:AAEL004656-PA [Aedes aegypti]|uniref:AAEL004656-PA n=1 Tax=Aedes aegypti TaxID=7159 RepID=Q17C75_AEDAE|nr:AAEL004656-PA [Aedes aegypti]